MGRTNEDMQWAIARSLCFPPRALSLPGLLNDQIVLIRKLSTIVEIAHAVLPGKALCRKQQLVVCEATIYPRLTPCLFTLKCRNVEGIRNTTHSDFRTAAHATSLRSTLAPATYRLLPVLSLRGCLVFELMHPALEHKTPKSRDRSKRKYV